ncbi:MAG: hypothetical protein U1A72_16530 [Sulfuritalea sp.]|nr:hypothetical protein [Sulfuritalea sp.]
MTDDVRKKISRKYCPRFGQIAVEAGFITAAQLAEAMVCQLHQELDGRGHRLLGQILFDKECMSAPQIDQVLTTLFRRIREEEK